MNMCYPTIIISYIECNLVQLDVHYSMKYQATVVKYYPQHCTCQIHTDQINLLVWLINIKTYHSISWLMMFISPRQGWFNYCIPGPYKYSVSLCINTAGPWSVLHEVSGNCSHILSTILYLSDPYWSDQSSCLISKHWILPPNNMNFLLLDHCWTLSNYMRYQATVPR